MVMPFIIAAAVGYLLGSIPFALIIGKVFFKTDIRNHGSGNLGGGNAGRVLGKGAGLSVMTLDILKVTLAIFIASLLHDSQEIMILAGLFAAVGHCFPVFARFKGGKAVCLWQKEGEHVRFLADVPVGVKASFRFGNTERELNEGHNELLI